MLLVSEAESLVTASTDQLPGSTLALSMSKLWQVIREQRDLNLPAHKVAGLLLPQHAEFHAWGALHAVSALIML